MSYKVWNVRGAFIVPGTRKKADLSLRVIGEDSPKGREKASAGLAEHLNEKFAKELPEGHKFSKHFAIYHLRWEPEAPAAQG